MEIDDEVIELGYVIHPTHKNMGYATEMLGAVIDELFRKGFSQVVTGAFQNNGASIKVMQKCGMVKISKEGDIRYQGVLRHCYYYAICRDHN